MKKASIFIILLLCVCSSCKTPQYIPVETVKTEYRDKIIRDSIFKIDTIRVPYPVEVIKQVKAPLTSWQNFQLWCGRILLAIALLVGLYFVLRLKKILP